MNTLTANPDTSKKRAAIETLYITFYKQVLRYIARRIDDIEEAEDMASEVFTRALAAASSYKDDDNIPMERWLMRIAHNLVIDYWRRRSVRRPYTSLQLVHHFVSEDDTPPSSDQRVESVEDIPSMEPRADPVELVERQETIEAVRSAFSGLTNNQRKVLALRFGAGLTYREVGSILGKRIGAIRETQRVALRGMREAFKRPTYHMSLN